VEGAAILTKATSMPSADVPLITPATIIDGGGIRSQFYKRIRSQPAGDRRRGRTSKREEHTPSYARRNFHR
jgi:hypothetical protein